MSHAFYIALEAQREQLGLTQSAFVGVIGIGRATYWRWGTGERGVQERTCHAVVQRLNAVRGQRGLAPLVYRPPSLEPAPAPAKDTKHGQECAA